VGRYDHQMLIRANKPIATPRDTTRTAAFAKINSTTITAFVFAQFWFPLFFCEDYE
jgi:hypothetical protein